MLLPSNDFSIFLDFSIEKILPSSPILLPAIILSTIQSMKSFFSLRAGFIRTKPELHNWFSACIKYLESVHNTANESVMTTQDTLYKLRTSYVIQVLSL